MFHMERLRKKADCISSWLFLTSGQFLEKQEMCEGYNEKEIFPKTELNL